MSVAPDSRRNESPAGGIAGPVGRGSALLGGAAVLIWNDVTPEGRVPFYEWHDKEHIAERLALPGFRRGRRLRNAGHSPEWLTIYEADDVSALVSREYLARLNAPTRATTATLSYFRNTSRAVCRVAHSEGASTGGHVLAMRLGVAPGKGDALCRYVRRDVIPRLMSRTGVLACHLFAADLSASHVNTAESSTRAFDVPPWVFLCEASTLDAASGVRDAFDGPEPDRLGLAVRDDFAAYALEICRLAG